MVSFYLSRCHYVKLVLTRSSSIRIEKSFSDAGLGSNFGNRVWSPPAAPQSPDGIVTGVLLNVQTVDSSTNFRANNDSESRIFSYHSTGIFANVAGGL